MKLMDRICNCMCRTAGFRKHRMRKFESVMHPSDSTEILDIGGTYPIWRYLSTHPHVTLLNLKTPQDQREYPANIRFQVGDALNMPFKDGEFDIAFSNSVIEHVATWENQQRFAEEIQRVGKSVWVQTPAYEFFMEPHYIAPFIHWLSPAWRRRLIRNFTPWGWLTRPTPAQVENALSDVRLLRFNEMPKLFPACEILVERWMGMPKSYIAYRK